LTRVRDSGGIVMVNFSAGFLTEECRQWLEGLFAERERLARDFGDHSPEWYRAQETWVQANPRPPCEVSDVADHIEQIRHVAGVDHVGLGSDFDGVAAVPDGLDGVDGYPALLAELASRSWPNGELAKLTWHNAVRVLRATESVAAQTQRIRGPSLATFAELDPPPHHDR
jgi:membrane dipeptidase